MYDNPFEYDLENANVVEDIPFWIEAAHRYRARRVLELGCGTGRLAIPLAKQGLTVEGLDINQGMLERFHEKLAQEEEETRKNLKLHHCDMSSFTLNESFDLIFVPFNTAGHLVSLEEQLGAFGCAHRHLVPGGRFIIDIYSPNLHLLALASASPGQMELDTDVNAPDLGFRLVRYNTRAYYEHDQHYQLRFVHEKVMAGGQVTKRISEYKVHVYFPREMRLLYMHCGFTVEDVFGDYLWRPFTSSSPRMIFVGRKV